MSTKASPPAIRCSTISRWWGRNSRKPKTLAQHAGRRRAAAGRRRPQAEQPATSRRVGAATWGATEVAPEAQPRRRRGRLGIERHAATLAHRPDGARRARRARDRDVGRARRRLLPGGDLPDVVGPRAAREIGRQRRAREVLEVVVAGERLGVHDEPPRVAGEDEHAAGRRAGGGRRGGSGRRGRGARRRSRGPSSSSSRTSAGRGRSGRTARRSGRPSCRTSASTTALRAGLSLLRAKLRWAHSR